MITPFLLCRRFGSIVSRSGQPISHVIGISGSLGVISLVSLLTTSFQTNPCPGTRVHKRCWPPNLYGLGGTVAGRARFVFATNARNRPHLRPVSLLAPGGPSDHLTALTSSPPGSYSFCDKKSANCPLLQREQSALLTPSVPPLLRFAPREPEPVRPVTTPLSTQDTSGNSYLLQKSYTNADCLSSS